MFQLSTILKGAYMNVEQPAIANEKFRLSENTRIKDAVQALALCHNVTPVYDNLEGSDNGSITSEAEADQHLRRTNDGAVTYQASSPDEVALVQWTQQVGLVLNHRDLCSMKLIAPDGRHLNYSILQVFPFTSETKRMGIIVKVRSIYFLNNLD